MSENTAREVALELLVKTEQLGMYSNIALNSALKKYHFLSPVDRRFISALYYGVIERRITLDFIIKKYSSHPKKLSTELQNILRLGLYQLLYMDTVPESAAVNESVKLAKGLKNTAATGYVNAILRSFLRDGCKLPKTGVKLKDMSIEYSIPEWIIKLWLKELGEETTLSILENSFKRAPMTARFNTLRFTCDEILSELLQEGVSAKKPVDSLDSCYDLSGCGSIEDLSAYKKGMLHIQDISCQICCHELGAKPGDVVLDMCSAPGGKAFTTAEMMDGLGHIFAYDLHKNRVRLVESGANRLGLANITAAENNAKVYNDKIPAADKILCDVPCSGLGVIRRKPDIKYRMRDDFDNLSATQYQILETSSKYLKPGGVMIYSTCTLRRAENDEIVNKFLTAHPEFKPEKLTHFTGSSVSITPNILPGDGFYIAKLCRRA